MGCGWAVTMNVALGCEHELPILSVMGVGTAFQGVVSSIAGGMSGMQ